MVSISRVRVRARLVLFVADGASCAGVYGYAATIAPLVLTTVAWIESLVILVLGNHRAEPQKFYGMRCTT